MQTHQDTLWCFGSYADIRMTSLLAHTVAHILPSLPQRFGFKCHRKTCGFQKWQLLGILAQKSSGFALPKNSKRGIRHGWLLMPDFFKMKLPKTNG